MTDTIEKRMADDSLMQCRVEELKAENESLLYDYCRMLKAENDRLRKVLAYIAANKHGFQSIYEEHADDEHALFKEGFQYYSNLTHSYERAAIEALVDAKVITEVQKQGG